MDLYYSFASALHAMHSHSDLVWYSDRQRCGSDQIEYISDQNYSDALPAAGTFSDRITLRESNNSIVLRFSLPRISLAKLSFLILAVGTLADHVVSRFSPEHERPRSSLGSAAIFSVTETLSPILPFTGGLDLRRDDYWVSSGSWLENVQTIALQISAAFGTAPESDDFDQMVLRNSSDGLTHNIEDKEFTRAKYSNSISANEPFISVNDIAELTLGEVGDTLRYAMESTREGFARDLFQKNLLPRVNKVINAMELAVLKSRGSDNVCIIAIDNVRSGEVDALMFAAALRVFGEWRIPRQVPEGFKGFAVGMNLGYKDVLQNLAKIEQAAHSWIASHGPSKSCGPTLRQLLEHEVDKGIHAHLPRLKDKTGAMGLLWVRRQLQYQSHIFKNFLEVPGRFSSTEEGVKAAYTDVYGSYHGWAVQKIFTYSFQSAPKAEEIFKQMNPHKLKELRQKHSQVMKSETVSAWHVKKQETTLLVTENQIFKNGNPVEDALNHFRREWDNLASHIVNEWDGLANHVVSEWNNAFSQLQETWENAVSDLFQITKLNENSSKERVFPGIATMDEDLQVREGMTQDAREQISLFLQDAIPMLDDLDKIFAEMNMNDPTKV